MFKAMFVGCLAAAVLFLLTPNPVATRRSTLLEHGYTNVVILDTPYDGDCSYFRAMNSFGGVSQGAVCDDGSVR
jgi:zona occludens toxin (predicted ATPase)